MEFQNKWNILNNFLLFLDKKNIKTKAINLKTLDLLEKYKNAQTQQEYNELLELIKQTLNED